MTANDPARVRAACDQPARVRPARRRDLVRIAVGWLAAGAVLALAAVTDVTAASPSPAPSEPALIGPSNVEAWLDVPLSIAAAPGDTIVVGFTVWDRQQHGFAEFGESFVRLHPARGSAKPTEATAGTDWPGHFIAEIVVPRGGVGKLDVGFRAAVCTESGACTPKDFLFTLAGVGRPPEAPLSLLLFATVHHPRPPIVAGEPIDLVVDIEPQAAWDLESFGLPDTLVAFASRRTGPDLATAELRATGDRGNGSSLTYGGQITIPEPGELNVQVAIPGNGTEDQILGGMRLTVGGTAVTGSPRATLPGPAASADGDVPWVLAGGVAVLVLLGSLVIRSVFADL